ncbi:MAG: peroxiredoxin [Kiritimatiellia bacterium]|jgi:peroxiredoxin
MDRRFLLGLARDWGLALVAAVAIFVAWNLLFSSSTVQEGEAPDFTIDDLNGEPVHLADLRGSPVVINFWATWCGPCVTEIPELIRFADAHGDIPLLGVSVDEDRPTSFVKAFAERKKITYPVMHDKRGKVAGQYSINKLPTTYIIDSHGHISGVHVGPLNRSQLERMLEDAH